MRRYRREAAAADRGDATALGLDATARLGVVRRLGECLVAASHLNGECTLPGLRKQLLRVEASPDVRGEAEPIETAGGEHDRVEAALAAFAQTRVDVAAKRLDREVRLER